MFVAVLLLGAMSCDAQTEKNKTMQSSGTDTAQDKPQVSWKVNKKYDEKGNLVGYDSTYTWSYSSKGGKMQPVAMDSIMTQFRKHFDTEFPSVFGNSFGEAVWSDSLFEKDFASPDYFMRRWEQQHFDMRKMMQQMDSLRNSFLKENYPGLRATPGKTQKVKTGVL